MRALRRLVMGARVAGVWFALAGPVWAQAPGSLDISEAIDDPKLERRLGARVELVGAPPAAQVEVAGPIVAGPRPEAEAFAAAAQPLAAPAPHPPRVPHLKLGYRRFSFAHIGPTSGPMGDEPFSVVSLDLYPISSHFRLGLSTQYGWQEGTFRANGDAFIAQSVALGGQIPGQVFTPFFEVHAGGGLMQRPNSGLENTIATAYGQLGVDVGTEIFMAKYAFLSAAIGWLRGTNGFVKDAELSSFSANAFTFKLGFGI